MSRCGFYYAALYDAHLNEKSFGNSKVFFGNQLQYFGSPYTGEFKF
jgi:hypothetical protein